MGVYVHQKPMIIDTTEGMPLGKQPYDTSSEVPRIDRWSTPFVLPGITQIITDEPDPSFDLRHKIPDAMISLDTSGSMTHPENMSYATLFGFIIANSYHVNGAHIGIMNCSTKSALLLPTRNRTDIDEMLCAYWGGGTVYDVDRLKEFFEGLQSQHELKARGIAGIALSSDEDYKRAIMSLLPHERDRFERKEISVHIRECDKVYQNLDHYLVTDGGIANLPEVIEYYNTIAQHTRSIVVVVGNESFAQEAKNALPNTQVIPVDKPEDLVGIAIHQARRLV